MFRDRVKIILSLLGIEHGKATIQNKSSNNVSIYIMSNPNMTTPTEEKTIAKSVNESVIPPHKATKFYYNKYRLLTMITWGKLREKYNAKRKAIKMFLHTQTQAYMQNQQIRELADQVCQLSKELAAYKSQPFSITKVPPGHFYSTVPSKEDVENYFSYQNNNMSKKIEGVALNIELQKKYLDQIKVFQEQYIWQDDKREGLFYFTGPPNLTFHKQDALVLHSIIRIANPKRIIEIGSGYSTAVMVDTNRVFQNNSIKITCIEPYPCWLQELFSEDIPKYVELHEKKLQDIDMAIFDELEEDDILFIDSTHVSKLGSDVNEILFEILPILKKGVIIHFHDIFYPFVYPDVWFDQSWFGFWNETYILRAFLQYNKEFELLFWGSCLRYFEPDMYNDASTYDASIWLRKR